MALTGDPRVATETGVPDLEPEGSLIALALDVAAGACTALLAVLLANTGRTKRSVRLRILSTQPLHKLKSSTKQLNRVCPVFLSSCKYEKV